MFLEQMTLWTRETDGYDTYRIPALVVSTQGTILAFCEGRKYGAGDAGEINILLKRSFDGGRTWGKAQLVVADGDMTCGNPTPVVDRSNGTIWLAFNKNLGDGDQELIMEGKAPRTVWMMRSTDDGATWSVPVDITEGVKDPSWTWHSAGPGHGIQTKTGRLVIPCCYAVGVNFNTDDPYHANVIYSDDRGETWKVGGSVEEGGTESAIVQTFDGALYINSRRTHAAYMELGKSRVYAWSHDEGNSFADSGSDHTLIDPECQGSLVRFTDAERHDRNRVLFANAASEKRNRMTVRLSYDECRTWSVARLLNEGPSAYSDLCVAPDMTICCLYEGTPVPSGRRNLRLARFDLEWLTDGDDSLQ
jgi:sialidase-1